jgi:hypothetical protein
MQIFVPEAALAYGFRNEPRGTHTSRTMMFREASTLFAATDAATSYEAMRQLVIDDNITLKNTLSTRKETFRRLAELYGLRSDILLYRALRDLWEAAPEEQPLLAMLCALARDPLLRVTAPFVLELPEGQPVTRFQVEEQVRAAYPDRYRPGILTGLGRRTISSWKQAGHLRGRLHKVRARAISGPASAAYALLLGYLCDLRGTFLFETVWAKTLDTSAENLDALAFGASQRGWLDYRRLGDVCELRFSHLMRS